MPRAARAQRFLADPHAWIDDPAVQIMSLAARGAYAVLWLAGWHQKQPGVYLADDRVLAQLARCTTEEWAAVRPEVVLAFDVTTARDKWILHAFAVTLRSQNRKRDTDRKRQYRRRLRERDNTVGQQRDSLDGSGSGSGSGSGAVEPKKKPPTPARAARLAVVVFDPLAMPLPDWLPAGAWADWCAHRREKRQRLTERAAKLCFAKLAELREAGSDPKSVLEQSIAGGWTGLFPLKVTAHANGNGNGVAVATKPKTTRQWCHHCGGSERWVPSPAPSMYLCDDCTQKEARR